MRSLASITPAALALLASVATTALASAEPATSKPAAKPAASAAAPKGKESIKSKIDPKKINRSHKKVAARLKSKKHEHKDIASAVDKAEASAAAKVDLGPSKAVAKPDSKSGVKADEKSDAKVEAKLEPKADPKTAEKAGDEPPPELTGSLPQAKLATKKSEKSEKKVDASDKDGRPFAVKSADDLAKEIEAKASKSAPMLKGKPLPPLPASNKVKTGTLGSRAPLHDKTIGFDKRVRSCMHPAVSFSRLGQPNESPLVLTTCNGANAPGAVDALSILARPYDRPEPPAARFSLLASPGIIKRTRSKLSIATSPDVAPGIRRLDAGIVSRVQAIADHFPGKTITVVSGYRPQSKGSPHAAARALDVRIDGVTNEALVEFCKTLADTGCGYYPNSSFVHVDVRPAGAGHVHWIDVSGPGEKPVYVKSWPLAKTDAALPPLPPIASKPVDEATPAAESVAAPGATKSAPTTDLGVIGPIDGDDHVVEAK